MYPYERQQDRRQREQNSEKGEGNKKRITSFIIYVMPKFVENGVYARVLS